MIDTLRQRHLLPVMAPVAILRGVGRIDFDKLASSFFRFDAQLSKEADHAASAMLLAKQ